jgi:mRNA-degrading endonuclease YafQ of YafQ-DinJ toxin-antitoxin module
MNRLKEAMLLLIRNDAPLGKEWLDHALTGNNHTIPSDPIDALRYE